MFCWCLSSQGGSHLCTSSPLHCLTNSACYSKATWKPRGIIPSQLSVCIASHYEVTWKTLMSTGCQRATPRNKSGKHLRHSITDRYTSFTPTHTQTHSHAYGEEENGLSRQREAPVFLALPGCGGVCVCASVFNPINRDSVFPSSCSSGIFSCFN